ncbi:MAG: XRE family transcriptional regulator [Planctomycetota bacterium]
MPHETDRTLPERIRALRGERGWSLRTLSDASGVSAGMLSDIERGAKSPTVRLAYQIARALGCTVTDLLEPSEGVADGAPARVLDDPEGGVERTSYPDELLHGRLEVATYRLTPGASTGTMPRNRRGTIEMVVALDGAVEVVLDGSVQRLGAGASVSHGVHATEYRNSSRSAPCRFLVLVDSSRC